MKETIEFEEVTPAKAEKYLELNIANRPLNQRNLNAIIFEIERNNFQVTGETIKISETNKLLDGQHRLWGIVRTGKTLRLAVARGLNDNIFKYLDTGRSRRPSDVLAIEGIANASKVAGMATFIVNFQRGAYFAVAKSTTNDKNNFLSNSDVSAYVSKNNSALQESYHYGFNKHNKVVSGVTLAALHFIFNKISESHADEFCHKLAEGSDIKASSPIYLLRQKLIADIRATRKMSRLEKMALICKAWNLYRTDKTVSILKWDSIKEAFPKPM